MSRQEAINTKYNQIEELKKEIRELCFEHIKEEKDIVLGDLIEIPSKNKFAIFSDLHTENVDESIIKTFVLTKLGLPSKKVTTFNINDIVKVNDNLETIISNNFSGEEFDATTAINACKEVQAELSK